MTSPLTSDPYKALGLSKDATVGEIKTAYRKLVLKCHPDKVQDEALKAIKVDEFQKVQQAYELLSDETRRSQYDDEQKLYELRKEMGRSGPSPKVNVYDFEVRTAEPRTTTYRPKPKETTREYTTHTANVYSRPSPRSYEEDLGPRSYEEPQKARARKTASYEEKKRPSTKDEEKRRKAEDERERERWEKEMKKTTHTAAKKSRDKDRKKGSEEKHSRSTTFVVDADDSEEYRPRATERTSSRKSDEELKARDTRESTRDRLKRAAAEKMRLDGKSETHRKFDAHKDFAAQYMQAARSKVEPQPDYERPIPIRRAETFQDQSFNSRYAQPVHAYVEEEDLPRRSSARRTSEQLPTRSRERPRSTEKEARRSPSYEPVIVDAGMPSHARVPSLQTHSSAPPTMAPRKEPTRSKTMDNARNHVPPPPPLPRASTFHNGDRGKAASRSSKLRNPVEYSSESSDSDEPRNRRSATPPPRRRDARETATHYTVNNGRANLSSRQREELRDEDYISHRARDESPRVGSRPSAERPPLMRSGGSGAHASFTRPYYGRESTSPEPIIKEVGPTSRPKMGTRESSRSTSQRGLFGEVKYTPNYGPEHISYTTPDYSRRGSDPSHHRSDYSYPPPRATYV